MYDFHCHSLLSDGELLPAELARRYEVAGYKAIAITDHVDISNIDFVIDAILKFCKGWPKNAKLKILPGIELTHLNLEDFAPLASLARKRGIKIIVAHGQTIVEPVRKGTNKAALEADIDILAHPGFISDSELKLAAKKGVSLELTSRKGHSLTNGYVAKKALQFGAELSLNNDAHIPYDIIAPEQLRDVAYGAGLSQKDVEKIYENYQKILDKYKVI
ncbi:MAG: histidinol phosphate phosphatase domain-containing protein [Candidatus Omnitrophica bacterium]|nr:histidinol phosphate phosphatase domain-containing protein [Candidatus Omnitrophota bacterium]